MALFHTQYVEKTYHHGLQSAGKMTKKKRVSISAASQVNQTLKQKVSTTSNASKTYSNQKPAEKSTESESKQFSNKQNDNNQSANKQAANKVESNTSIQPTNQQEQPLDSNSKKSSSEKRNYAIDGLRALAIIGIVFFHMRPSLLPGGFLGVTLFLVLAGYFCTRSVLKYLNSQVATCYFKYLWRRIKRIWPSTIGIIAVTAPIMWIFSPSLLPKLQSDALSGAGFFSNIIYVTRKLSYFEQSGLPSPIKHLWYLGLVMQAFVVWPIVLILLVRLVKKAMVRMYITAGLAVLSAILTFTFGYLFGDYAAPARVYYSLDTRASEFLLGAMLAMYGAWFAKHSLHEWLIRAWYWIRGNRNIRVALSAENSEELNKTSSINEDEEVSKNVTKAAVEDGIPEDLREGLQIDLSENSVNSEIRELPDNVFNTPKTVFYNPLKAWQRSCIGLFAAIVLCYCFVYADGTSSVFSFGGYTITAAVCTLIVWSCTQTDNICSRIFAWKPLAYLGKRAFAIYLVHFPVLELCNPATRTTTVSLWEQLLQAALTVALAECFYQVFEKESSKQRLLKLVHYCAVALSCIIVVALILLPVNWTKIAHERSVQLRPELTAQVNSKSEFDSKKSASSKNKSAKNSQASKAKVLRKNVAKKALPPTPSKHRILFPIAEKVPQNLAASHNKINKRNNTCSVNLTMVGDSITEGAKPYLLQVMPNAYIDGKVSRQIFHGADEYEQDIAGKHAGDVVIFALGTNGPPHDDSVLQHMVDVAKGKPVYFVTTRVPQPWQDVTNSRLRNFAATHPNVGIIDWYGLSQGHSEYLTDDGVHLTPVGGPKYAKMIRLALCGA